MSTARHNLLVALGIIFVFYCLFQARFLILGPQVTILSPEDGAVVHEPLLTLGGTAKNTAWLSLNGRQIFTDEEGLFTEKLILSEGISIMTVRAKDRFGRERSQSVRVILN